MLGTNLTNDATLKGSAAAVCSDTDAALQPWGCFFRDWVDLDASTALRDGATEKRPTLEKFIEEALPLIAVNLEQFVQPA